MTDLRDRIRLFVGIAAANGSPISVEELRALLPAGSVEASVALERFLETDEILSNDIIMSRGEVAPRGSASLLGRSHELRNLAQARLQRAQRFAANLSKICSGIEMVGVSGSTAHGAAKDSDDIDFFLVTSPGRLWSSLFMTMFLAKLERVQDPGAPVFCFNRVLDIDRCRSEFSESRDPITAREALSLQVVIGKSVYRDLLQRSKWMADTFPTLYRSRKESLSGSEEAPRDRGHGRMGLLERATFAVLGPYLWMAGLRRNRWLEKHNRSDECFRTIVRKSICAYESNLYEEMRRSYRGAFS